MKSRSIFRILNARNLELIPPNNQHLPQDQFGRKTMLCVWWDQEGAIYYEPGETVNAHHYHQQLIKLHRALREKRPHYQKRHEVNFPPRQRTITYVNNGPKLLGDTQLRSATSSRFLTRPGTF